MNRRLLARDGEPDFQGSGPNPRRRALFSGIAAAALAPHVLAQQERVRVVGYLTPNAGSAVRLSAALAKLGWVEGRNVRYEVRFVATDGSDADEGAAALVKVAPDVLVAASGGQFARPLARATRTIPVVAGGISDPVVHGLARSLQQPGMNVTGLSFGLAETAVVQLGTLRLLVPGLRRVLFVTSEHDTTADLAQPPHFDAARSLGLSMDHAKVADTAAFERALATIRDPAAEAAWIALLPPGLTPADVAQAAIARRVATHGFTKGYVRAGCLMSYWRVDPNRVSRMAALVDKILRGADPARIPFELPDTTEFTLNRATARALGITLGPDLLVRATEVFG